MKVLVVTPWFPSKDSPIAGIFIAEQARALAAKHEVTVLHLGTGSSGSMRQRSEESLGVYKVIHLTLPARHHLHTFEAARAIAAETLEGDFDLIHAHVTLPAGFASVLGGIMCRRPVIVTEHFTDFDSWMQSLKDKLKVLFTFSRAAAVIAVSQSFANQIHSHGIRRLILAVPNLIDPERFSLHTRGRKPGDPFRLLFVGRLCEEKNLKILLCAMNLLQSKNGVSYHLKIIGDGPETGTYAGFASDLRLGRNCEFTKSFYDPDRIAAEMSESDVFVLPSHRETFGIVIAEAMGIGRPVVATRCGGPEEIVTEPTGILVPPDDANALAEAIGRVCSSYESFRPEAISDYAHRRFGAKSVVAQLTRIYDQVAGFRAESAAK
jgi:glycosyltransferase involved in cell wall biosynthesis